jgi:tetratricopeptide (TPR) repeat protein
MQTAAALLVCLIAGTSHWPLAEAVASGRPARSGTSAAQQAPAAGSQRAEAERLANAGQNEAALKLFQAMSAANPDDLEARMWIAKLHLRMGQPVRASGVYESIVATQPQNVDAWLGLGTALMDAGRWHEAGDALNRAEALAGDRIDVLASQGRFHGAEGRSTLALAYYGKALVKEPGNADIVAAADALRAARAHRAEVGYDFQKFDDIESSMHSGTVRLNLRANDALRVFGHAQAQTFDDETEGRFGGGVEWFANRSLTLRAGAFGGGNVWLPSADFFGHATINGRRVHWTLQLRYFDFDGADLWIGGPGIALDLTPRVVLEAEYLRGRTGVDDVSSTTSDNASIGLVARLSTRVRGSVFYHRGIDRLDWLTLDRLTADDANTMSFELAADPTPFFTLSGGYDFHDRSDGFKANRARGWLTYRF